MYILTTFTTRNAKGDITQRTTRKGKNLSARAARQVLFATATIDAERGDDYTKIVRPCSYREGFTITEYAALHV